MSGQSTPVTPQDDITVSVRNLWKVFGSREQEALQAAKTQNLGKQELQEQYSCVLGVQDVSFDVKRGEILCIMGLSGSGKSTLLRHLNQLIRPSSGKVRILGQDVDEMDNAALRKMRASQTGMVFQHMALMPHWTVRENVVFPLQIQKYSRREAWKTTERVLSLVGLDRFADYAPDQLSGGMKQRVGLARALAADPPILLMDEPFSALDPLIRRQLQDLFMDLSRDLGKSAVFITHDLDEAIRIGDRIAIMKDGRIVQSGAPRDIIFNPADDYVADFVQHLSQIKFLTVADIMRPFTPEHGETVEEGKLLAPDMPVEQAMGQMIGRDGAILVGAPDEQPVGIVTKDDLLSALL